MLIAQNVPVAASPASSAPVDFRNVANSEQQRTLAVTNIRAILNMAGMDPARPVRIQIRGEPIAMRTRGSAPEVEAPPTASMATTLPARSLAELAALPKPGLTCTPTTFELLLSQESNVPGQSPRAALVHVSFNEINHGGLQYGVAFAKPWDPAQNDYVAPKGKPIDAWAVGATVSDTGGNPALVPEEANAVSTLLSLAIADPAALNIDTLQDGRQFIRPGGSFMLNP